MNNKKQHNFFKIMFNKNTYENHPKNQDGNHKCS